MSPRDSSLPARYTSQSRKSCVLSAFLQVAFSSPWKSVIKLEDDWGSVRRFFSQTVVIFQKKSCLRRLFFPKWQCRQNWCVHHDSQAIKIKNGWQRSWRRRGKLCYECQIWSLVSASPRSLPFLLPLPHTTPVPQTAQLALKMHESRQPCLNRHPRSRGPFPFPQTAIVLHWWLGHKIWMNPSLKVWIAPNRCAGICSDLILKNSLRPCVIHFIEAVIKWTRRTVLPDPLPKKMCRQIAQKASSASAVCFSFATSDFWGKIAGSVALAGAINFPIFAMKIARGVQRL